MCGPQPGYIVYLHRRCHMRMRGPACGWPLLHTLVLQVHGYVKGSFPPREILAPVSTHHQPEVMSSGQG
jgi:hypothetical protein